MDIIMQINSKVNNIVWGPVMLILLVGTGIYFSFRLKFLQVSKFGFIMRNTLGKALKRSDAKKAGKGAITPFQAMSTALAGTVGTGNIAGVATAIASGGPGAVFWMWLSAFFGMVTKYAEVALAVHYRKRNKEGEWSGGPMYYIKEGMGKGWGFLAALFALFAALASFGIGNMSQVNTIASSVQSVFGAGGSVMFLGREVSVVALVTGIVIAVITGIVIIGGIKRIGSVTEKLVPFMAVLYIVGSLALLALHVDKIPAAFSLIFSECFSFKAAAGGVGGYVIFSAMRYGVARGVFSNEAGLGSAPIAHAAAEVDHPARQGIYGVFEVFADTIVICTMTAMVILTSGLVSATGVAGDLSGAPLTAMAFGTAFGVGFGNIFVAVSVLLFAFSTIISWSYYGVKSTEYLLKSKTSVVVYKLLFIACLVIGATMKLEDVWDISDTLNGLMAIPNLIALLALSGVVLKLSREYFSRNNA